MKEVLTISQLIQKSITITPRCEILK